MSLMVDLNHSAHGNHWTGPVECFKSAKILFERKPIIKIFHLKTIFCQSVTHGLLFTLLLVLPLFKLIIQTTAMTLVQPRLN